MSSSVATIVYPPGSFSDPADSPAYANRHPIRVFQFNSSTQACPRNTFLIMAIMQLDCDADSAESARKPFYAFIEKSFAGLVKTKDGADRQPCSRS